MQTPLGLQIWKFSVLHAVKIDVQSKGDIKNSYI